MSPDRFNAGTAGGDSDRNGDGDSDGNTGGNSDVSAGPAHKAATHGADGRASRIPAAGGAVAETPGIGQYAERGLHAALKTYYGTAGGLRCGTPARYEVSIAGKVADVMLPDELVEVQTRNLGAIVDKILHLACVMPVRVVHPVITSTEIVRLDPAGGEVLSTRTWRWKRTVYNVFDELVRAPLIVASPNVRFDVIMVGIREVRVRDGSKSWRKRGDRVLSRDLVSVEATHRLDTPADWLAMLGTADEPYDSLVVGKALGIAPVAARKMLYTYGKAGLLVPAGMNGRRKLYLRV